MTLLVPSKWTARLAFEEAAVYSGFVKPEDRPSGSDVDGISRRYHDDTLFVVDVSPRIECLYGGFPLVFPDGKAGRFVYVSTCSRVETFPHEADGLPVYEVDGTHVFLSEVEAVDVLDGAKECPEHDFALLDVLHDRDVYMDDRAGFFCEKCGCEMYVGVPECVACRGPVASADGVGLFTEPEAFAVHDALGEECLLVAEGPVPGGFELRFVDGEVPSDDAKALRAVAAYVGRRKVGRPKKTKAGTFFVPSRC